MGGYGSIVGLPLASSDSPYVSYESPTSVPCLYYHWLDTNPNLTVWGEHLMAGDSSYGPELSLFMKFYTTYPTQDFAVIKVGIGATNSSDWWGTGGGGAGYGGARLLEKIAEGKSLLNLSGEDYQWGGLFVLQGETDAQSIEKQLNNPSVGNQYITDWVNGIQQVRDATSTAMPVIFGRIGDHMLTQWYIDQGIAFDPGTTTEQYVACMRQRWYQQSQVVAQTQPAVLVDMNGLDNRDHGTDSIHWPDAGYLAAGERFLAGYQVATAPRRNLRFNVNNRRFQLTAGVL